MPLEKLVDEKESAWALWRINEDESVLAAQVFPLEEVPAAISNQFKRLEFLAGRVLIKTLIENWSLPFYGLIKDEFGKPFARNHSIHISLSHSYPYAAAVIHRNKSVGIDLEQPKEKLLKIASRVLNKTELIDAGEDPVKHCLYWSAKEAMIKIYGKRDLVLSKNLAVAPFLLEKTGVLTGRIVVLDTETTVRLNYEVYDNFVVVLN
jgi:phosphopantetheinyl transferase